MRAGLWALPGVLCACIAVAVSALAWLGKNVFDTSAMRNEEIRTARIIELTHEWETAIFRDWERYREKLDAISPKDFSEESVHAITKKTRFHFPARISESPEPHATNAASEEKFSLLRENGTYVLRRQTPEHGTQCVIFDENELFSTLGKKVTEQLAVFDNAALRLVPVNEERGFGIIRGLPGAKLIFELAPREHAESLAAKRAVLIAGTGVLTMLAAIVLLAIRVFSLSEKRYLFAHAVSHELKTPLAELRACTETALTLCRDDENMHNELATIHRSSRELNAIVENLLIFSRMKNGKLRFSPAKFSVENLFSRIFDRLGERLIAANMDAIFDIDPEARKRRLRTSVEMLGRILFNLADNAAKYAYRENEENAVTFRVRADARLLYVDVEDDGPGIPEPHRDEIFRPFERGNAHGDTRGLGLGLPISAEVAKMLGGKLFLLKSDGTGTTFRLEIPLLRLNDKHKKIKRHEPAPTLH